MSTYLGYNVQVFAQIFWGLAGGSVGEVLEDLSSDFSSCIKSWPWWCLPSSSTVRRQRWRIPGTQRPASAHITVQSSPGSLIDPAQQCVVMRI